MPTRKKNAEAPRQGKLKPARPAPATSTVELSAMMMIGNEQAIVDTEEDDNIDFMAEFIDPA